MTMSKDLSTDDLGVRRDLQDALHLSVMNFSMSRMTLPVMKMDVIVVVDGVESSPQMAQAWALLPCEIKTQSHWAFLWDEFLSRDVLKS